jgi:hypothetical protein
MTTTENTRPADGFCCDEYAAMHAATYGKVSRRGFLGGAMALAGATTVVGGGS